jgi:hypothetical protein
MPDFSYDETDKLRPCADCGSRRCWFDGEAWQCWNCNPPPSGDQIRVDLDPSLAVARAAFLLLLSGFAKNARNS